jgi:hypothetical protein
MSTVRCTMDTQSMLMPQLALSSSPEHYGHEEHVYRALHYGQSMLMSQLALRQ